MPRPKALGIARRAPFSGRQARQAESFRLPRTNLFGSFAFLAYSIRHLGFPRARSKGDCMKAKRMALLGMLVCMIGAVASAQIAPSTSGDIGLFTIPTADTPRAGQLTLGVYGWKEQLAAGNLAFSNTDFRSRQYSHWAGEVSLGFG